MFTAHVVVMPQRFSFTDLMGDPCAQAWPGFPQSNGIDMVPITKRPAADHEQVGNLVIRLIGLPAIGNE